MNVLTVLGTTKRLVDCGQSLHRVPTEVVMASLADHIAMLAEGASWYACVLWSDGRGTLRGNSDTARRPPDDMVDKMLALAVRLNRDLHHDGHWITFISQEQITAFWRDRDGDLHFEITYPDPWVRIRNWSVVELADRAEGAYREWTERMRAVDASKDKTIKLALGEAPARVLN